MTREEKYPNTMYFNYYNANPKNRITDDCVIRGLCTFLDEDYIKVFTELFNLSIKTGYSMGSTQLYTKYLEKRGYTKQKQPKKHNGTKYNGKDFCVYKALKNKRYFAHIGGHHVVAIVNCKVNDTWDSTDGCIGNYWVREV